MWYRRNEQAGRMSLFLAANGLATIICSPVAYGLSGMVAPVIESWRVLYLLVRTGDSDRLVNLTTFSSA
jgi:ACS family allantoate permease-like MFS transporter